MDKSPAQRIITCKITVVYLLILILSAEVNGQTVRLETVGSVSTCSSGLRDRMDFYLLNGTVDATVAKYSNLVDFQIKPSSSNTFGYLCTASLVTCVTPNPQPCYCAVNNSNVYTIVANRSAVLADSQAFIRIHWDSSSSTSVDSNELQVPQIYNVSAVTTIITKDGSPLSCPGTVNNGSVIKLTCNNSPSPCEVWITLNKTEKARAQGYVNHTVNTSLASNSTIEFTFSHSVCGGPVIQTTCLMTIVTPEPYCPLKCHTWAIILSVFFYIAIIVIIICGIIILFQTAKEDKKSKGFYASIVLLVLSVVLDIILIIVFAQAEPCTCDPGSDTELALWEIMLIIFCIVSGTLIIAAVFVCIFCSNKSKMSTSPSRGSAAITSTIDNVSATNTRTQRDNNVRNTQK